MAQNYTQILNNPEIILWAKTYLKKSNRISWYLKMVKKDLIKHPSEPLKHYFSMNIPEIEAFPIEKFTYGLALMNLQVMEEDYLKKQAQNQLISVSEKETVILSINEYSWVNLNEPSCSLEAEAMGHCGNSSGRKTDSVLSLRKKVIKAGREFWEPHLTFILDIEGFLGEMKGKQNAKPHEKYHSQIWQLLVHPLIKGFKVGGYLPENNFHLADLPEAQIKLFLEEYSFKLSEQQKLYVANRHNLQYFVFLEAKGIEAKEAIRWVKVEDYKTLVTDAHKEMSIVAAQLIKDKAEIKSLTALVPRYSARSLYDNKGLTQAEALSIFKKASTFKSNGVAVFYAIKKWSVKNLITIAQHSLKHNLHGTWLMMTMNELNHQVTSQDAESAFNELVKYDLDKEKLKPHLHNQWLKYLLVSENHLLQKELYPLVKDYNLVEKLLMTPKFVYGEELVRHFYNFKIQSCTEKSETEWLFRTDDSFFDGVLKAPQTLKALSSEEQISFRKILGQQVSRVQDMVLSINWSEQKVNDAPLRITLHKNRN